MSELSLLQKLSKLSTKRQTLGLDQATITKFLSFDPQLGEAIRAADSTVQNMSPGEREILTLPEAEQIALLQDGFINFYPQTAVNPYIPLAAKGPWIITSCGAVVYDAGGYGMMGFGHNPSAITAAFSSQQVMANIMTANFSQKKFIAAMRREIGKNLPTPHHQIYSHFLCLNSGSEAMTLATRFADINCRNRLERGEKRKIKYLAVQGSFHGRTDPPAHFSDSSLPVYRKHLASFMRDDELALVPMNDTQQLAEVFAQAEREGVFFQAFFLEPVMGEGDPGKAASPEFYRLARQLSEKMGSLLIVDSIQAGIRAHGCLSIVDYPGMGAMASPDIEVFSKALNAGQFPLSVLAVNAKTAALYVDGVYGNTMTSNPRALDIATATLEQLTPALAANIENMGNELLREFQGLQKEFPQLIRKAQGTGLMLSLQINEELYTVTAKEGLEWRLRQQGCGVIHGGKNSLRFTPRFGITREEIALLVAKLRELFICLHPN
jgi:acetylornithine/succinyldiaminopimelate/putrescine aminotransferase